MRVAPAGKPWGALMSLPDSDKLTDEEARAEAWRHRLRTSDECENARDFAAGWDAHREFMEEDRYEVDDPSTGQPLPYPAAARGSVTDRTFCPHCGGSLDMVGSDGA